MAHGIWNAPDKPNNPKPYGVQWRELIYDPETGESRRKTRTEYFTTSEKRDRRASDLRKARQMGSLETLSRQEQADWKAFKAATAPTPWPEVVAGWKSWVAYSNEPAQQITVARAVDEHLVSAGTRGLSEDTIRQKTHKLTLFAAHFGTLPLTQITGPMIEEWITGSSLVKMPATFNSWLKHISALFGSYVKKGLLRRNPASEVHFKNDLKDKITILTPQETARLFQTASSVEKFKPVIAKLALEAFLGLRFSSACRVEKADINFSDRGVLLPKHKIKTRTRHYVDGMPDQLWEWLAIAPDSAWKLSARAYMKLKSELFLAADVPHPHNCLRHSFCTYDMSAHKNPGRTATLLCHTGTALLWSRYNGRATQAAGRAYQSITPATAARIALTGSADEAKNP